MVQKALNALYGALAFMRNNKDADRQADRRALRDSARYRGAGIRKHHHEAGDRRQHGRAQHQPALQLSLDMAKLGGMKDLVPAAEIMSTQFKPVPTKL